LIVGTAGHIDHGKTALIRALTGVDVDRLKEEQARGMTLDLGFAYKPLDNGEILGFVDVPGHERFVHNMLSGAIGVDYVLLVVAADDGVMPQTREHVAILHLLGLDRGVVALTKTDLVSRERIAAVRAEITTLLAPTSLTNAPLIPVSNVTGAGIPELAGHLRAAAAKAPARRADGHFRLAVDRCFTLAGAGVVVTGTVFSGRVAVGDRLLVSPSGLPVRVRGIHAQNQATDSGQVGQRCALNLSGAHVDKSAIKRGDWILARGAHAPTTHLDARLHLLNTETRALRHWAPAHVHLGAADLTGRVAVLEGESLKPGTSGLVQLVLNASTTALLGDRFILRDQSASRTLGGGTILDPLAPARGRRRPQRLRTLFALERANPVQALENLLVQQPEGVDLNWFMRIWNLPADSGSLRRGLELITVTAGDQELAFRSDQWTALLAQIVEALKDYHARFPNRRGATADGLRRSLPTRPVPPVFAAAIGELIDQQRTVRAGPLLHLPRFDVRLSASEQKLRDAILPLLRAGGLRPPRLRELIPLLSVDEKPLRALLHRLAEMDEVHEISSKLYFPPETTLQLAAATQRLFEQQPDGTLTVAAFRQHTGVSRNIVFEVLEFFDRMGFTLRVHEGRRLRRDYRSVFGADDVSSAPRPAQALRSPADRSDVEP
jgi:selenocysteine-specific elongation factor